MYMGVQSHRGHRNVSSYEQALALHEKQSKTPTGKARKPIELYCAGGGTAYPLGLTKRGQTRVIRYGSDDSIAFRLYETDVVTWYPDNSVSIENYGTVTTSEFATNFLPAGISLRHPVNRRSGASGGDKGIAYGPWGKERMVCQGTAVRFTEGPDGE